MVLDAVPDNATAVGVPARVVRINGMKVNECLDQIHVADPVSQELCRMRMEIEKLQKQIAAINNQEIPQEEVKSPCSKNSDI